MDELISGTANDGTGGGIRRPTADARRAWVGQR